MSKFTNSVGNVLLYIALLPFFILFILVDIFISVLLFLLSLPFLFIGAILVMIGKLRKIKT